MPTHLKHAPALLACIDARSVDAATTLDRLSPAEWQALPPLFQLHGIGPLAYVTLNRLGKVKQAPENVQQWLISAYERNAARNMVLFAQLDRISEACRQHDIPVIPLKGAHLARRVYADPALRVMGDIDIQVRPGDEHRVAELLRAQGYESEWTGDDAWRARSCHLPPFHKEDGITVEVHIDFKSPFTHFRTANEDIWQRALATSGRSRGAVELEANDLFLYLCIHLYRARLRVGLRHLVDLGEVIRHCQTQLEPGTLVRHAREWNMERILWTALTVVKELLGTPLPDGMALMKADIPDQVMLQGIRHRIFGQQETYSINGLLYWSLQKITAPWRRYEVTLPAPEEGMGNRQFIPLPDKLKRSAGAVAGFLRNLRHHPGEQTLAIRNTLREHRFDRWMMWP